MSSVGALEAATRITWNRSDFFYRGDRVCVIEKHPHCEVERCHLGTVTATSPSQALIKVRSDAGEQLAYPRSTANYLQLGYALTLNQALDVDVERPFVLLDWHGAFSAHWGEARVFMPRGDASPEIATLVAEFERQRVQRQVELDPQRHAQDKQRYLER